MIYIAVPYSHKDSAVQAYRFKKVTEFAAKLISEGKIVFSPISHSHPIARSHDLPHSWEYWQKTDEYFLKCATELYVLCLPGWEESTGVQAEIEIAEEIGLPITYIALEDIK